MSPLMMWLNLPSRAARLVVPPAKIRPLGTPRPLGARPPRQLESIRQRLLLASVLSKVSIAAHVTMAQPRLVFAPTGIIDLGAAGDGGSGARRLAINGLRHIAKCPGHANGPWVCFNEFLAARIATRLGLPVPDYQIVEFKGSLQTNQTWFCSREIEHKQNLDALAHATLSNRHKAAGVILFDVWLCNVDRKSAHVLVDKSGSEPKFSIIDHGHTLLTSGDCSILEGPDFASPARFLSQCSELCSCVYSVNELGEALREIHGLDGIELKAWMQDSPSAWIPDAPQIDNLAAVLLERRKKLAEIIEKAMPGFPNIARGDL